MIPTSIAREHAARILRFEAKVRHEGRGTKNFFDNVRSLSPEADRIANSALQLATPESQHEKMAIPDFVWALCLAASIAEMGE